MRRTAVNNRSHLETLHTYMTETNIAPAWTKSRKLVGAGWTLRRTLLREAAGEEAACCWNSYRSDVLTIVFLCPEFIGE